jgi:hypothetical protein
MTDLLTTSIGEDDSLLPQQVHGLGWYLAETGDLWELTEEGWYMNGTWIGKAGQALVPVALQRLLTCEQWTSRVRHVVRQDTGKDVSANAEWIFSEVKRDELFPDDEVEVVDVRARLLQDDAQTNALFPLLDLTEEDQLPPMDSFIATGQGPEDLPEEPPRKRGFFRR